MSTFCCNDGDDDGGGSGSVDDDVMRLEGCYLNENVSHSLMYLNTRSSVGGGVCGERD